MTMPSVHTRRSFLQKLVAGSAMVGLAPPALGKTVAYLPQRSRPPVAPNDRVQFATIGMGIIGFINTHTALELPGVELVAAADCYDARLVRTKEVFGDDVETSRDYREILSRDDVDAVLLCVPDHWHAQMSVEAMEAGKAVYCEKPMVHDLEEGPRVLDVQQATDQVFQVGSHYVSSVVYEKARELYASGIIGELNMVEAQYNRRSALGAWQYSIPPDASPETIDWDGFLGNAPDVPFDADRFFRWRKYWDYGTGVAGDLYVHLFSAIHYVLQSNGPTHVVSTGGLRYWHDGREAPDVMLSLYEYPETDRHPDFTLSLQTNFADGSGGGQSFRFIGSDGVMSIDGDRITVTRRPARPPSLQQLVEGYNSVRTWSEEVQQAFIEEYEAQAPEPSEEPDFDASSVYEAPDGYDARLDHLDVFFEGIRSGGTIVEDAAFGYRAAAPSLLTNRSYRDRRMYAWDPDAMTLDTA